MFSLVFKIGNVSNAVDGIDDGKDRLVLLASLCVEPTMFGQRNDVIYVSCSMTIAGPDGRSASLPEKRFISLKVVEPRLMLNIYSTPRC